MHLLLRLSSVLFLLSGMPAVPSAYSTNSTTTTATPPPPCLPPTHADSASVLEILLAESQHQELNFLRMGDGRTGAVRSDPLWVAGKSGQDWIGCRLKMERLAGGGTRHPEREFSRPLLTLIQEAGRMSAIPPPPPPARLLFRPGSKLHRSIALLF